MTADVSRISNWHAVFLNRLVVIRMNLQFVRHFIGLTMTLSTEDGKLTIKK